MLKKIFVVGQVKNESDIIESYCRYNLLFSDGMLLYDNNSCDNTRDIIQKLIKEGLPIYFADDIWHFYKTMPYMRDKLTWRAIDKYGATYVINLDADEFLYHVDGINPRETLEALDEQVEYHVPWRTFIYENEPEIGKGFMPNNFVKHRDPKLEHFGKTIICKTLIKERKAKIAPGAHMLIYPDEFRKKTAVKKPEKLVCAHFPLRSKAQLLYKAIPGWITLARLPFPLRGGRDVQYLQMWEDIKTKGEVARELIAHHCVGYGIPSCNLSELEGCGTIDSPLDISFCQDKLELKYTNYDEMQKTFFRVLLIDIEKAMAALPQREWETIKLLEEAEQQIYNSRIWKFVLRLKKILNLFRPSRKRV